MNWRHAAADLADPGNQAQRRIDIAVGAAAERLELQRIVRQGLRAYQNGHIFGHDRRCKCGMAIRDYHWIRPSELTEEDLCHLARLT